MFRLLVPLLPVLARGGHTFRFLSDIRNNTCLDDGIPFSQRRNVVIGGKSQPLRLGLYRSTSALLEAMMYRIIVEDTLGVHVEFEHRGNPMAQVISQTADCEMHLALGVWEDENTLAVEADLKRNHDYKFPIQLGDMGYGSGVGLHVKKEVVAAGMQEHLPLDFYLTYSHPQADLSRFFDGPRAIIAEGIIPPWLEPCWAPARDPDRRAVYENATGDLNSTCFNGTWWLAPACRSDVDKCIPVVVYGAAYAYFQQYAFWWDMPFAITEVSRKYWYKRSPIVNSTRVLFDDWTGSAMYSKFNRTRVRFPPHDPRLWSQGIFRTEPPMPLVRKMACRQLEDVSSENTRLYSATLENMRMRERESKAFVAALARDDGRVDWPNLEPTACAYMRANKLPWRDWIASGTLCISGQGIASDNGTFTASRHGATTCIWCSPGRLSVRFSDSEGETYRCEQCSPGRFQDSMAETSCKPCASGESAAQPGASGCAVCPLGRYAMAPGSAECDDCPASFVTADRGATSRTSCLCPSGQYRPGKEPEQCLQCPKGIDCAQGADLRAYRATGAPASATAPLLRSGFWSSREEPLQVFNCESVIRCPGGRLPGEACAVNLEGQGCAHCVVGYYWDGAECASCGENTFLTAVLPLALFTIVPFVLCFLYWRSIDEYRNWAKWSHGVKNSLLIVVNYYQTTNVLRQANLQHKPEVSDKLDWFAWISDISAPFHLDCHGVKSFSIVMLFQCLAPLFPIVVYLSNWGISQIVAKKFPNNRMQINRTLNGFMSLLLTFFAGIAESTFTVFKCGTNPSGVQTLLKDRSINCYESDWYGMLVIGIFAVLVWCVGYGALLAWAVWTAPKKFHMESVQHRWRFLFMGYRPDVHWWGLAIIAKGVLMNLGSLITTSGFGQTCWIMGMVLIYVYLTAMFRPWRHQLTSQIDIWVNMCLFVICLVVAWFAREASMDPDEGDRLANFILALFLCAVATPMLITSTMQYLQSTEKGQCTREQYRKEVATTIDTLRKADRDHVLTFLSDLGEDDMWLMIRTGCLIQSELTPKGSANKAWSPVLFRLRAQTPHVSAWRERLTQMG